MTKQPTQELLDIPLDQVIPDPGQPRKHFDPDALRELADSIVENGLIQPIGVIRLADGRYQIEHGERRWRAHQLVGLPTIRAIVSHRIKVDADLRLRQFVENFLREDLNIIEQANFYRELIAAGIPMIRISRDLGKKGNTKFIKDALLWLEMEEDIQVLAAEGKLSKTEMVARALLTVPAGELRVKLAQSLAAQGATIKASVAACEKVVAKLNAKSQETGPPSLVLALNGRSVDDGPVRWKQIRDGARAMCDTCSLNGLISVSEPAWHLVMEAAGSTCSACIEKNGSYHLDVCRGCPGVEMVRRLANMVGATPIPAGVEVCDND